MSIFSRIIEIGKANLNNRVNPESTNSGNRVLDDHSEWEREFDSFVSGADSKESLPKDIVSSLAVLGLKADMLKAKSKSDILGLLKNRYRELAKSHHGDISGDDSMMKEINLAYDTLKGYYGNE
jgi:hypothetical protein